MTFDRPHLGQRQPPLVSPAIRRSAAGRERNGADHEYLARVADMLGGWDL